MARLARLVIPGLPHHVTQRGNGRARTFFDDSDYELYRHLLAEHCRAAGVEVWAWCLMPNHVHLILVPSDADGLRRASGRAPPLCRHHPCAAPAQRPFLAGPFRLGCHGRGSPRGRVALRIAHPVRARLVTRAQDWRWSRARAHLVGKDDGITARAPVHRRFPRFADLLALDPDVDMFERLRAAESIGRPLGDERFWTRIERSTKPQSQAAQTRAKAAGSRIKCDLFHRNSSRARSAAARMPRSAGSTLPARSFRGNR